MAGRNLWHHSWEFQFLMFGALVSGFPQKSGYGAEFGASPSAAGIPPVSANPRMGTTAVASLLCSQSPWNSLDPWEFGVGLVSGELSPSVLWLCRPSALPRASAGGVDGMLPWGKAGLVAGEFMVVSASSPLPRALVLALGHTACEGRRGDLSSWERTEPCSPSWQCVVRISCDKLQLGRFCLNIPFKKSSPLV